MSAWRRLVAAVTAFAVVIFAVANWVLYDSREPESGRPYRVEINRLAQQIENNGYDSIDLSQCEYVNAVVKYSDHFYNTANDYSIREINGELYRFDYSVKMRMKNTPLVIWVNVFLGIMTAAVLGVLFYVRKKILRPFARLINVPYELSKGNLTLPVKECKNRFFGKFLWGLDVLRENIEQQKQRELDFQKEKKMLLLSLSHDIKTPLSAIQLYAKALAKNLYPDPQKQFEIAGNINAKADEIERYVSQIITASHEDFLSLDVENSAFYLSDLIKNVTAYYKEKLTLVKTEFMVGEYTNVLLSGDLKRSVEVLQNVIENALKYGDGKCVELLFPEEDGGVCVAVKNSGCTLDKADLPHIFESFRRGANAESIRGNGLGLYICRQLMHKMNGEIFAQTEEDTITVTAVFMRA